MNKDEMKMIEDMATYMVDYCDRFQMCPHDADSNVTCDICKARSLYNANCRIIADDEIVVKKQAYEEFVEEFAKQEEIAHSYEQGYTELLETNHQLQDELEKAKQEKREIFYKLKETLIINNEENTEWFDYDFTLETINELAKSYGIELED